MKFMKRKFLFLILALIFLFGGNNFALVQKKVEVYFFWGEGCPHCAKEKPFLEKLKKQYPQLDVKEFEVYHSKENQELFEKTAKAYNTSVEGVPTTFIGKDFVVGFDEEETTGKEIESLIKKCVSSPCPQPSEVLKLGNVDKWKPETTPTSTSIPTPNPTTTSTESSEICIHYFIKENCLQCQNLAEFLNDISQKYNVDLKIYNISESKGNQELYQKLQEYYKISYSGFPIVFLGDTYLIGDKSIRENIEKVILRCQKEKCPCPVEGLGATLKQIPNPSSFVPEEKEKIKIPLFGRQVEISSRSSILSLGAILGLADGINPCMFSVLLFLLTYLLAIGSKKRAIKVGLVFVLGVFVVYLLFMLGMLNLITLFGFIQKVKIIVAIFALIAGLIMIKDFFAYGKWFSLEIPESAKPTVEKLIKKGTIPSAILLALLSSLVELPCTAGIPLVYTTLLAQRPGNHIFYVVWYNLFFVIPLLIIISGVAFAWARVEKIEKWRMNFRKYMRLIAGLILLFLAVSLWGGWL